MSIKPSASLMERRNASTVNIDRLTTLDMLAIINKEDKQTTDAIASCLPDIARLVDNAAATLSRGGRIVMIGAGASGRAAMQTACEYAPDGKHPLLGLIAGGPQAMTKEIDAASGDYDRGVADLEAIEFNDCDMLIGLSVSGKTPWVWGAMRHAWSLGAQVAAITQNPGSEAAQLASIVLAPDTGPEVVAGFANPKAHLAQKQILNMLTTGLAVRSGRVYSNLRVDLQANDTRWAERQIAIVMAAAECSRAEAKAALESCHHHCRTAILMVLTGLDAWRARDLLAENHDHLRLALQDAKRVAATPLS